MKMIIAWLSINVLLIIANLIAAVTAAAYGTLLLGFAPLIAQEWASWWIIGIASVGSGIAFLMLVAELFR